MYECFAYMCVLFAQCVSGSHRGQKRVANHLVGHLNWVLDSCKQPSGCWELNTGPLEEQTQSHFSSPPPPFKEKILAILMDNLLVALSYVILVTSDADC